MQLKISQGGTVRLMGLSVGMEPTNNRYYRNQQQRATKQQK
jgi:hypothetical protein